MRTPPRVCVDYPEAHAKTHVGYSGDARSSLRVMSACARNRKLGLLRPLPLLGATRKPPHLYAYPQEPPVRLHERAHRARVDSMLALSPISRNYGSTLVTRSHLHPALYEGGSELATSSRKEAVPASGQTDRRQTDRRGLTSPELTDQEWQPDTGRYPGSSSGLNVFEILGYKLQPQNSKSLQPGNMLKIGFLEYE
jgi:hypothetical protein